MSTSPVSFGIIGLGQRGNDHLRILLALPEASIVAVCDKYEDRALAAQTRVTEASGTSPFLTTNYNELLARPDVTAVVISTDWEMHVPIAIAAMRAGKTVALEVGGAYTVEDCHRLVQVWEETRVPFMFLENCCYYKDELLATAMVRDGRFGRIVHCSGSYSHDLRKEVATGKEKRHYRLRNYLSRNAENYPTHELGPIARLLNVNRGNRMVSLVSVASLAAGMESYVKKNADTLDPALQGVRFAQGDIVNTIITCQNGETILLTLDTTLPRSYSRSFTVRGTDGFYTQETNSVFLDGEKEYSSPAKFAANNLNNAEQYVERYLPDIWKTTTEEERKLFHGGMDGVMWKCVLKAIQNGEAMPIDVYDAASWMVVTALSEESIRRGGAPMEIPDFTSGAWLLREPQDVLPLG